MADDKKKGERTAPENAPTPTQAEADEFKAKLVGGKVEARAVPEQHEALAPTPTQAENDAAKLGAMPGEPAPPPPDPPPPEGGTQQRRHVEPNHPSGGYSTRAAKAD